MGAHVTIKSNLSTRWALKTTKEIDRATLAMATDVHRFSGVLAPKDTYALVNSGKIERLGSGHYKVSYGGGASEERVPYAKLRHFVNRKNPHTLRYLERAGQAVAKNKAKYLNGERMMYR